MRPAILITCLLMASHGAAGAQLQELFSRHVKVVRPQGKFAGQLIKVQPGSGSGWREVAEPGAGFRISIPSSATIGPEKAGNRVLRAVLAETRLRPFPVIRVDSFAPKPREPDTIDADYVEEYARQYPEQSGLERFTVTDRGLVLKGKKQAFAMVGGTYFQDGKPAYRVQWAYLSKDRQLFITFDCAEDLWPDYQESAARILLSLNLEPERR